MHTDHDAAPTPEQLRSGLRRAAEHTGALALRLRNDATDDQRLALGRMLGDLGRVLIDVQTVLDNARPSLTPDEIA